MKWRILLELTETTGSVQTREMVTGDRPTNVISPESIGLSLAESKSILAAMQTQLVQAQTDGYCDHRRNCSHCGSRRGIKDWRTRQFTTHCSASCKSRPLASMHAAVGLPRVGLSARWLRSCRIVARQNTSAFLPKWGAWPHMAARRLSGGSPPSWSIARAR